MAYMTFDSRQDWKDYQDKMDDAMWGVFAKDAPDGGYWELVHFTKFLSRFLMMGGEDILRVLDKPYQWSKEYEIYKKFQKLVDGETDAEPLHSMNVWDFSQLETAMIEPKWGEIYTNNLY